jgi:outer membrane protein TolC
VLFPSEFLEIVRTQHPISRQADISVEGGDATFRMARGGFDPKAIASLQQKNFDGSQYYSLLDGGFKLPSWLGVDFEMGIEQNRGEYLNPENKTPSNGLYYAGLRVPIGQGLIIDKRRAEFKKAQSYQDLTEAQRSVMLNDLLFDAGKAYWDWFIAYHVKEVYDSAFQLAVERFEAVKTGSILGDAPSIDTLEAGIQVQNRRLSLEQANLDYINSTVYLSIFLWLEGFIPIEPSENMVPIKIEQVSTIEEAELLMEGMDRIADHPELRRYQFEIDMLDTDRRWKKEQLKPVLDIKYNALAGRVGGGENFSYNTQDYQWGFQFIMPIFLRKERGALQLANLKIEQKQLDVNTKQADLGFKVRTSLNEWNTTNSQIETSRNIVRDYGRLLDGERRMFNAGESSLFMVNARELGYINSQIKLVELVGKNKKAELKTNYAFGSLSQ